MPCFNDLEQYLSDVESSGPIKEFEVVCDKTNNTEQSIAEGRLNVDLVFHGSLAQHVRDSLERAAADKPDECNRT